MTLFRASNLNPSTMWKVLKYGVFSGPYFPAFGSNMEIYRINLRIQSECEKKTCQKILHIWTLFTQCTLHLRKNSKQAVKTKALWGCKAFLSGWKSCRAVFAVSFLSNIVLLLHHKMLILPVPIPDKERKLTQIFVFTLCGVLKAFIKLFEVPHRSAKMKKIKSIFILK